MTAHYRLIHVAATLLLCLDGQVTTGFSASSMIRQKNAVSNGSSFVASSPLHMTATSIDPQNDDPMEVFRQAREFALADDVEFEEHYHPYGDYGKKLDEANLWLQQVAQLPAEITEREDEVADVVAKLEKKAKRYEKKMHKGDSTTSLVPSIALELSLGALIAIVAIFWTTLDMNEQHGVTPLHLQDWISLAQEKGYLVNMLDLGQQIKF